MKSAFLSFLFIVTFYEFACAQRVALGFRIGAAYNMYRGSDWIAFRDFEGEGVTSTKIGPAAGIFVNSMLSEFFWIKTDFMYINRGFIHTVDHIRLQQNEHYIDAYPLSPTFHFRGFQFFAGPSISAFFFNSYQKYDSDAEKVKTDRRRDPHRRLLEFGLMTGIEYETDFGLNFGLRYVHPFTSMYNRINDISIHWYNQSLILSAGFSIGRDK
ncbi:outer membrane beta-barrel protein [Cytophagaceae bacterium ABcell3]|nr:outer membrane beta-barrel protein [Cytophagaceae bacterium ABcell3]